MRVLIVFAHQHFESSRINRAFHLAVKDLPNLVWHDLYEAYPNQLIDVPREQALITDFDVIIFQHPLYWYSCPSLLKNWLDNVLTVGWAYGEGGTALKSKAMILAISSGGSETVYQRGGYNNFSLAELLRPFEQIADLCDMSYHQPFLTHGARAMDNDAISQRAEEYRQWLQQIMAGKLPPTASTHYAAQADFQFN